jgi:hypothetical protein
MLLEVGFALLAAGFATEFLLYFFGTAWLGRLAFLPFGSEVWVAIGPAAQARLSGEKAAALAATGAAPMTPAPDYRSLPAAPKATAESIVHALAFPAKTDVGDCIAYADADRDTITVRMPFQLIGLRTYGIVRTQLRWQGSEVSLHSRFLPVPFISYVSACALLATGFVTSGNLDGLVVPAILLIASLVHGWLTHRRLHSRVQKVRLRLETALYGLR